MSPTRHRVIAEEYANAGSFPMRQRERALLERLEASGEMAARRDELTRWFSAHPDALYWEAVAALGCPDYMLPAADSVRIDMTAALRRKGDETCRRAASARVRRHLAWLPGKPRRQRGRTR